MGVGSPSSRDLVGEGVDDFYISRSGRCADLPSPGRERGKRKQPHTDQYEEGIAQDVIDESQHGKVGRPQVLYQEWRRRMDRTRLES